MSKFTPENLRKHWESNSAAFGDTFSDCRAVFDQIAIVASIIAEKIAGRRALGPNCAYLLLAKSLNHSFSTMILLEHGLLIDAALTSRNGMETLLLLELLLKQ